MIGLWDGTEGGAGRLLDVEMASAQSVADAGRALDAWVMRVAIAREKSKEGNRVALGRFVETGTGRNNC